MKTIYLIQATKYYQESCCFSHRYTVPVKAYASKKVAEAELRTLRGAIVQLNKQRTSPELRKGVRMECLVADAQKRNKDYNLNFETEYDIVAIKCDISGEK